MSYFEEKPVRRNLRCPHCGGDDLAFVTEYHKAYGWRFLEWLCVFALVYVLLINLADFQNLQERLDPLLISLFALGILWFIFHAIRSYVESKTHIQAICRTCGNYWLLN